MKIIKEAGEWVLKIKDSFSIILSLRVLSFCLPNELKGTGGTQDYAFSENSLFLSPQLP